MSENRASVSWPGWEVGQVLGRGGYGTVYAISRQILDTTEQAALKVITIPRDPGEAEQLCSGYSSREDITSLFRDYKDGILREYITMSRMKGCANIVSCDDFRAVQHEDGIGWDIYIKMELLTPLRKVMETGISESAVRRMGIDVCNALVYCAERNVLHRDIKPANIFASPDGTFKLGDFGIARTVEAVENATYATRIGTTRYMAPEIYNNRPYSGKADIYSLGLVLYELLNDLRAPFEPPVNQVLTAGAKEQALNARFSGRKLPLPAHGSRGLQAVVMKACAFDPEQRFSSAAQMLKALRDPEAFLRELEGVQTTVLGAGAGAAAAAPVQQASPNYANQNFNQPVQNYRPPQNNVQNPYANPQVNGNMGGYRPQPAPVQPVKKKSGALPIVLGIVAAVAVIGLILALILPGMQIDVQVNVPSGGGNTPVHTNPVNPVNPGSQETEPAMPDDWDQRIVAVAAGKDHAVGLRADGTVVATGNNTHGQCNVSAWSDVVAIDAGPRHTVGIRADGTVLIVGANDRNQLSAGGWSNVVAVSVHWDSRYIVAIRADGTVLCTNEVLRQKTAGWYGIKDISAGSDLVGLRQDGTILVASADDIIEYHYTNTWSGIQSIAAGAEHAVGLRSNGTIAVTGNNGLGQIDVSGWGNIVFLNAGQKNTLGIRADGSVVIAGYYGECFTDIYGWRDIVYVDSGDGLFLGVRSDGTVVAAGDNSFGECNVSGWYH